MDITTVQLSEVRGHYQYNRRSLLTRNSWRGSRLALGLGKRRPKSKPTHLWAPVKKGQHDAYQSFQVPDYPAMILLPLLTEPRILSGRPSGMCGIWEKNLNLSWPRLRKRSISSVSYDMDLYRFGQMLCKIAHSFAVAECGLYSFTPLLLDLIKTPPQTPFEFVGGYRSLTSATLHLHTLDKFIIEKDNIKHIVVMIRLFAYLGGPA